jgi:hypothetical protein
MQKEDWTLNIGAAVFYSLDNENSNNKLYVYPKFNALQSSRGLNDFLCWCRRNLQQNSYMNFANENLFLFHFDIKPTDQQYDVFAGLKGKIVNNEL